MLKLYRLKKTIIRYWLQTYTIDVSTSLSAMQNLMQACIKFESQFTLNFEFDRKNLTFGRHPGGIVACDLLEMIFDVRYEIDELSFNDEFDCLVAEAEIKAEIVRLSTELENK